VTSTDKPVALIIGAGPGIGRSLANQFAAAGHPVALIARRAEHLEKLATELAGSGARVITRQADASDAAALAEVVTALRDVGPIGVLAYNAVYAPGRLATADLVDLRTSLEVNVLSAIAAAQAALPDLEAVGGSVLLTGGGLALYPDGAYGVLSMGKAALRTAALALATDLAPRGIRVRTLTIAGFVAPGTAFDPDRIAARLIGLAEGEAVEEVYRGEPPG
jgi:short-subunit dehydrogenase